VGGAGQQHGCWVKKPGAWCQTPIVLSDHWPCARLKEHQVHPIFWSVHRWICALIEIGLDSDLAKKFFPNLALLVHGIHVTRLHVIVVPNTSFEEQEVVARRGCH
jgi:hypothetical protein